MGLMEGSGGRASAASQSSAPRARTTLTSVVRLAPAKPGTTRLTLGIDGTETFDVIGERTPRADLTLVIHRRDGQDVIVPVTCRLDSDEEVAIYEAGGVLQRFAQ